MRKYTGRTRYRLHGFFSKLLVLQVEEEITACRYPDFYTQTWIEWRDATFDDVQRQQELYDADKERRRREFGK